jgi:hypothetical protein
MDTPNLKIHLANLEDFGRDVKPFQNLTGPDLPFKLGYFTDKLNQELCMGKEVNTNWIGFPGIYRPTRPSILEG